MPPQGPDVPVPMFEILVNSSTLSVEAAAHVVQVSVEEDTELPDMFSLEIVATDDLEDQFLWVDSEDLFSVGGSYVSDLLPGMVIMSLGVGPMFVGVTTAANSGVPADKAGLAAALVNASQQVGGALGLAIFTALATSHTNHLLAAHVTPVHALNSGLQRGLLASAIFLLASAFVALKATNTRGEQPTAAAVEAVPEPAAS